MKGSEDFEYVKKRISYDPDTGIFTRVWSLRGDTIGKDPCIKDRTGHRRIKMSGQSVSAGRIAFLLMTGEWPKGDVDHIDRDPTNNVWTNLRDVSRSANVQNTEFGRGVSRLANGKWQAYIHVDNSPKLHLGTFVTEEEALAARADAVKEHHPYRPETV
jgi:hypothetical protein